MKYILPSLRFGCTLYMVINRITRKFQEPAVSVIHIARISGRLLRVASTDDTKTHVVQ
jgi:hypothetical protein